MAGYFWVQEADHCMLIPCAAGICGIFHLPLSRHDTKKIGSATRFEMAQYLERSYRKAVRSRDLVSFQVGYKETDIWVSADERLEKETMDLILDCRHQIETYMESHPSFVATLSRYPEDPFAPPVVREMIGATRRLGVGPMASVAGAIAQYVAKGLLSYTDQVIVENGGDIFLQARRPVTVSVFAGASPLSQKVGLRIPVRQMPLGVCSSSGTVGHSLSRGKADAVCLVSPSAALADGAATALGNKLRGKEDLERASRWAFEMGEILGGLVIMGNRMATWGDVELAPL